MVKLNHQAGVAELADALDLGSSAIGVGVRLPSSAPLILLTTYKICGYRISANTPAFQAGKVGSIPTTRSIKTLSVFSSAG